MGAEDSVILVAGTSIAYFKDEECLVSRIAAWAARRNIDVWYRLHPRRCGRQITVCAPTLTVDSSGLDAPPAHYRRLLEQAVCVVAAFSTLCIEAALMGKPSLIVAFGASTGGSEYGETPRGALLDHAGFAHMADVITKPGVRVCRSEAELFQGLEDHAVRRVQPPPEELRAWASRIAHCLDGGATQRMVDLIERVAR